MEESDNTPEQKATAETPSGPEQQSKQNPASQPPMTVPNNIADLTPHHIPWTPSDYAYVANGKSAEKLHSSAIAPIVAAARGYEQIEDNGRSVAKQKFQLCDWRTKQGRRLRESLKTDPVLIMPWYTPENVIQGQKDRRDARFNSIQYRPVSPGKHENGKEAKYEFVSGSDSVIGLHPSTPEIWLTESPVSIIAEGLFKADAAVSAMLIASDKISDADLLIDPTPGFNPQARLLELLSKIEREYRIPVFCIGGVYNWKNNFEWNFLDFKGKTVWVAIDGDIATNVNVHRAGTQLWNLLRDSKHATPKLLSPEVVGPDDGTLSKMGIDDYLFSVGNWTSLVAKLRDKLPPRPPSDGQELIGEWRVEEDGLSVSECVATKDASGNVSGADWERRVSMGGRISVIAQSRYPTKKEDETGVLGVGVADSDEDTTVEVTVEVKWMNTEGVVQSANIVGPHTFLNYSPDQWDRHGARIPHQITTYYEWPPKGRQGQSDGWLRAIKQHRTDEISNQVVWQRMGWVPVKDGIPAFIVGEQTVAYKAAQDAAISGVTESQLASATVFGVGSIDDFDQSFNDEAYRASVRKDLDKVMQVYVTNRPWQNAGVAALILAAALRPAIPIRPRGTLFVVGPPGKGKMVPLDSRIPVPVSPRFSTGWALNRDLVVGDEVYGPDGNTTKVFKLSDVLDDMDMFEFTMGDGQKLRSSVSHLWNVSTKNSRNIRDRELNDEKRTALVAEAGRLRGLAGTMSNSDGLTVSTLARLIGHTYSVCDRALNKSMTVSHDVVIYDQTSQKATLFLSESAAAALAGWTYGGVTIADNFAIEYGAWLNTAEIARAAFGVSDRKKARAVGRKISAADVPSKEGFAVRKKSATVFPSAEAVLAVATHLESRATYCPYTVTMTSEQIAALPRSEQVAIELAAPFDGPDVELPIDPYTFGAWLGDGTSSGGGFTGIDLEITDAIESAGFEVTHSPTTNKAHYIKGILPLLRELGALNNKHIPAVYARASATQRFETLRGLMDTDGYVNEDSGQCELSLCNRTLAVDALSLIRSLGIRAAMHESDAAITEMIDGERVSRVTGRRWRIRFTPTAQVFKMRRKAERVRFETSRHPVIVIDSIERLAPEPSRCITVDNSTSLFLTDGFLPTHNSWTAAAFMGFWSKAPGGWASDKLPGSANDTAASIELAMSRAVVWTVDDYHPTTDSRKAMNMHDKIADLVRFQYNGNSKRRATNTMGSMKVFPPHTALVITGENELTIGSAKERLIAIEMRNQALHPIREKSTDVVDALCQEDGAPARLAQGLIRFMQYRAATLYDKKWEELIKEIADELANLEGQAEEAMNNDEGSKKRSGGIFADYIISLHYLREMALAVGWTEEQGDIFLSGKGGLGSAAMSIVREQFQDNRQATPGKSTLRAIRALLNAGKGHILNGDDHATPPVSPTYDSMTLATQLGWASESDGSMRAKGIMIGYLIHRKNDGAPVLLLHRDNAFTEAQRSYSTLVPAGQTVDSSWSSVQDEKLLAKGFKPRNPGGVTTRLRIGQNKKDSLTSGVPILLSTLLGNSSNTDDDYDGDEYDDDEEYDDD